MRRFIGAGCALLLTAAAAEARPSTLSMSCGQAASVVASAGAIVLSTGRHTYARFVAGPRYCPFGDYAEPAWAPTADARSCRIGYVCRHGPAPWEEEDHWLLDR